MGSRFSYPITETFIPNVQKINLDHHHGDLRKYLPLRSNGIVINAQTENTNVIGMRKISFARDTSTSNSPHGKYQTTTSFREVMIIEF